MEHSLLKMSHKSSSGFLSHEMRNAVGWLAKGWDSQTGWNSCLAAESDSFPYHTTSWQLWFQGSFPVLCVSCVWSCSRLFGVSLIFVFFFNKCRIFNTSTVICRQSQTVWNMIWKRYDSVRFHLLIIRCHSLITWFSVVMTPVLSLIVHLTSLGVSSCYSVTPQPSLLCTMTLCCLRYSWRL